MAPSASPSRKNSAVATAGLKRRATSLLPAFEPLSSSPTLPRPLKRTRDAFAESSTYPTPVPTSSTAILSSSPPRFASSQPSCLRSHSTVSERAPLSAVPSIQLTNDGKPVLMGRSSVSCDYQLSSNRLISRVHVETTYRPATSSVERDRVEILCTGWNGIKVHCLGKIYALTKGKAFTSDVRQADIMVDVQDARVLLRWPPLAHRDPISSDEEGSPSRTPRVLRRHSTPPSPLQARQRLASPVSPSPAVQAAMLLPSSPLHLPGSPSSEPVVVYEDKPSPEPKTEEDAEGVSQTTLAISQQEDLVKSHTTDSSLSESQEFSDHDEENDPIVHSFGPFGANLLPRMASFSASDSPRNGVTQRNTRSHHPLQSTVSPSQSSGESTHFDIRGHIINQLAFSRLSSTPLSILLSHLPEEAGTVSKHDLKSIINQTGCIGEVAREGKDAAGKALESEYYYIPDQDEDEKRKEAVVNDLMKPGLRACRKQHKQYFWRKPKKP